MSAAIIRRELMGCGGEKLIKSISPSNFLTIIPMVNYFHSQEQKYSGTTSGLGSPTTTDLFVLRRDYSRVAVTSLCSLETFQKCDR